MVVPHPFEFIELINRCDEDAAIVILDQDGNELFKGPVKEVPYITLAKAKALLKLEQQLDLITPYQWFLTVEI